MGQYDDIIDLPHHVSSAHARMPIANRAAQFSPFQALTGYEDAVDETARLTEQRIELDESAKAALDEKLKIILDRIGEHPVVTITYFQPDERRAGGAYVTVTGAVKKIDDFEHRVILLSGQSIAFYDIFEICSELFA